MDLTELEKLHREIQEVRQHVVEQLLHNAEVLKRMLAMELQLNHLTKTSRSNITIEQKGEQ